MPRKKIDLDRIIDGALAVLSRLGRTGMTMRAVASELRVDPMALYNHVDGKTGLEAVVASHLLAGLALPDAAAPWRTRLIDVALRYRQMAIRHPAAFEILFDHETELPAEQPLIVAIERALADGGVAAGRIAAARRLLVNTIALYALEDATGWPVAEAMDEAAREAQFLFALEVVMDGLANPALRGGHSDPAARP